MDHKKVLNNIRKIVVNLIIIVLVIIAFVVIWGFVQLNVQKKEYINFFGYSIFSTETGSMAPTMNKGDIVIVKIGDEIREKDIITYKKENVFITHRIVSIEQDSIITKGDNNNTEDEPINKEQVIGTVVFIANNVEVWKMVFSDMDVIFPGCITIVLFVLLVSYKEKVDIKSDEDTLNKEKTGEKNV